MILRMLTMKKFLILTGILISTQISGQQKPNIILIVADDLGYADISAYGQKLIQTPNLDKLSAMGKRFTRFYAGSSVCAPSRASLMTGLHTGHTAVRGNKEIQPEGQFPIPDSSYTLGKMFKAAGYTTGVFGKWGLGFPDSEGDPVNQGFDEFFGYNCQRQSHNFFPAHLWNKKEKFLLPNSTGNQIYYAPDTIQSKLLDFVSEHSQKPFFLYLAYTLPHAALQMPENDSFFIHYRRLFNEAPVNIPASWDGKGYQPQAYPRSAYAAMVSKLDAYIGELVERLVHLKIDQNTLILFTSDNGPHAEGGNDPEFFNSNGPFRGIKRDLYEGGIRVPLIASWPSVIKKANDENHVAAAWDLMATFAEILAIKIPVKTDGISFLPTLQSKKNQKKHTVLYWEFHEAGGRQAVRFGDWKAVRQNVFRNPADRIELYHLVTDPSESINLAGKYPRMVAKAARIMDQQHTENPNFPFIPKERED